MDSGSETKPANSIPSNTTESPQLTSQSSRYESQKRRDFNNFLNYIKTHKTSLSLSNCSSGHVIEYLNYLDQFGKTKVHMTGCNYFGNPNPPTECGCPLKQAWGSLDALIGRLRAAFEENGGPPESNPFGQKAVTVYLREVRERQAKARGVAYKKKKKKVTESPNATEAAMSLISFSNQLSGDGGGEARFNSIVPVDANNGGIKKG